MSLLSRVKNVFRMCGHALSITVHERLDGMEQRGADTDNARLQASARLAERLDMMEQRRADTDNALLQASVRLAERVREARATPSLKPMKPSFSIPVSRWLSGCTRICRAAKPSWPASTRKSCLLRSLKPVTRPALWPPVLRGPRTLLSRSSMQPAVSATCVARWSSLICRMILAGWLQSCGAKVIFGTSSCISRRGASRDITPTPRTSSITSKDACFSFAIPAFLRGRKHGAQLS